MLSQYVQSIDGTGIAGVVFLLVAIAAFVLIVIRTLRADRQHLRFMEHLPLDEQQGENTPGRIGS